jgi:hypothetical protein
LIVGERIDEIAHVCVKIIEDKIGVLDPGDQRQMMLAG